MPLESIFCAILRNDAFCNAIAFPGKPADSRDTTMNSTLFCVIGVLLAQQAADGGSREFDPSANSEMLLAAEDQLPKRSIDKKHASPAGPVYEPRPVAPSPAVKSILTMIKGGVPEDVILIKLERDGKSYDLSADDLVALKQSGASAAVLQAMLVPAKPRTNANSNPPAPSASPAPPLPHHFFRKISACTSPKAALWSCLSRR